MRKITLSYSEEQYIWLEKHPEINRSGVFRLAISHMMKNERSYLSEEDLDSISKEVREKSL